jgi:hypothetical protein
LKNSLGKFSWEALLANYLGKLYVLENSLGELSWGAFLEHELNNCITLLESFWLKLRYSVFSRSAMISRCTQDDAVDTIAGSSKRFNGSQRIYRHWNF